MTEQYQEKELFREERLAINKLLADNPNYFGTVPNSDFKAVQYIQFNTAYEELTCVGLWPERNLLEATLVVKLPFGFKGDVCSPGSHEYVRFFIDWNNDGDFSDANEDLGLASVNVHDIPEVEEHKLCYAVRRRFQPFLAKCEKPYIVRLRAILSWEIQPPPGDWNFIPPWGNVLDCWVQIDPISGRVLGTLPMKAGESAQAEKEDKKQKPGEGREPERERSMFLELLQENPNYFGTLDISDLEAVNPFKGNTSYEELKCIGLYPERDFLEAVLVVKRPYGFMGDLCSPGSYEYVRFYIDWNGDGDFVDFNDDAGVAAVNVHDIPEAGEVRLCYALGRRFKPLFAHCQKPYIVRVRAILSWQQVPTGPNFTPVWGNVVECWVQIRPTHSTPRVLTGNIDTPALNDCVEPVGVAACLTDGAPLYGIPITGSAEGLPFDHYTLRYSWGGNPPVNNAVVYPDCSRPPASPSASVAVSGGTLGYLDVMLLPPGVTEFTIYLDVFDAGAGVVSDTTTFKLKTTAVDITEAATVIAVNGEDPFHAGSFTKLIKATNDVDPAVKELSIGGSFSVTGSANVLGCDRIMTQFVLAHFDAPPANPVPNFPNATGGTQLIAPVVYADSPSHPWSYACIGDSPVSNIISNGNLVAFWSNKHCTFLGINYQVGKVAGTKWDSRPLNGRYVILLETRDRLVSGSTFPGAFAAKDQVAVWIDNFKPTAKITSIGGEAGCGDLRLSDFVGTTAEVCGIAWDPPIVSTAPQQAPNENFGSYSLGFQKNASGSGSIPGATPNDRVPNIWPGPLAATDEGLLADWDIVTALDGGAGPLPAGSEKLERGTRCAYVLTIHVVDKTHVGDSGNHNHADGLYAINIINDL